MLTLSMAKGTGTVFTKEADEYLGRWQDEQFPMATYFEVFGNQVPELIYFNMFIMK